ncbi:MAG: hypothetical protein E6J23_02910 [Chloroflexi bacterium]|nr:MAG: hypothetical protein E6J23_02910 [Chloroflexota bacterium]
MNSVRCYFCGAGQLVAGRSLCTTCGRTLQFPPALLTLGRAYLLNRLDDLVGAGALDENAADRIRAIVAKELESAAGRPATTAVSPVPPPTSPAVAPAIVAPPAPQRVAPPIPAGPSFAETFFTPERAPSLLLYLGAFLVVVAALIFVNVSGQQISDSVRVALMIVGTLGFLGGGLVCYRIPRVEEAGRTFLIVGALLVPLDFGAYYALVAHVSPFTSPAMWVLGSLVAAGLYATLAIAAYGRAYSYLFFVASLSALAGIAALFNVPGTWLFVPLAAYPLAIQLAARVGESRTLRLVGPLELPGRFLLPASLLFGVAPTVIVSLFSSLSLIERLAIPALAILGTAYYAARTDRDHRRERWLAVAGPAAVAFGFLFSVSAPLQTYGFVSSLLAVAYALVREVGDLAGAPSPFPMWARDRARIVGYALIAIALLPPAVYWRAPLVGATTYLGTSVLLGGLAVWRARTTRQSEVPRELIALVLVGAGALHIGAVYLLIAAGLTHVGVAVFSGIEPRVLALGFTPIAAGLAIVAAIARRKMPTLADAVSIATLGSAILVVSTAFDDSMPLATILATAATLGAVASAVDARRPMHLWVAAGFAAVAAISAARWLQPPDELRPLALAAAALLLFVPAYLPRFRASEFARVAREIGIATSVAAVGVGLGYALARPVTAATWDAPVWLATSPVFSVFGAITFIEALHRRSERVALFATTSFLASVLIVVARLHPSAIEAFTLPAAIYLGLAAWGIARFGSPALRAEFFVLAQIGAAVALLGPTYVWSWEHDAVVRTIALLAESVILLGFASTRGLRELGAVSIGALGLVVLRAAAAPLALESSTAAFGLMTIALALTAPRMSWRLPSELREATEVVGVLLVLAPPLVRATAFGDDALAHGATVLAGGALVVALGLWSGRRALVASAAAMLAAIGVLALRDAARAEPFVAATGVAVLALVLAIPRYLPRRLPAEYEIALEILAVGLVVSSGMERTFTASANTGGGHAARVLVESIALLAIGLASSRRALASAGLGAVALGAVWILADPAARQFHGLAAGAALVAIALGAIRYAPKVLAERALIGAELLGGALFVMPSLLASWNEPFFPGTPIVFFEIALLMGVGVVLRRRWLVAGALAALGLETLRASIDVVNRLPNWALFGGSGAILLTAGFVLLIKREAWNAWSRRAYQWWSGL